MPSVLGELCEGGDVFRGYWDTASRQKMQWWPATSEVFPARAVPGRRPVTFGPWRGSWTRRASVANTSLGWRRCSLFDRRGELRDRVGQETTDIEEEHLTLDFSKTIYGVTKYKFKNRLWALLGSVAGEYLHSAHQV